MRSGCVGHQGPHHFPTSFILISVCFALGWSMGCKAVVSALTGQLDARRLGSHQSRLVELELQLPWWGADGRWWVTPAGIVLGRGLHTREAKPLHIWMWWGALTLTSLLRIHNLKRSFTPVTQLLTLISFQICLTLFLLWNTRRFLKNAGAWAEKTFIV